MNRFSASFRSLLACGHLRLPKSPSAARSSKISLPTDEIAQSHLTESHSWTGGHYTTGAMTRSRVLSAPQIQDTDAQHYTVEWSDGGGTATVTQGDIQKRKHPFARQLLKSWILANAEHGDSVRPYGDHRPPRPLASHPHPSRCPFPCSVVHCQLPCSHPYGVAITVLK
eukprot:4956778-Pyramimonas_sp.AAC.1